MALCIQYFHAPMRGTEGWDWLWRGADTVDSWGNHHRELWIWSAFQINQQQNASFDVITCKRTLYTIICCYALSKHVLPRKGFHAELSFCQIKKNILDAGCGAHMHPNGAASSCKVTSVLNPTGTLVTTHL